LTDSHRTLIGPYEIVAPLGAGGMGEVYRAWDPRLQREVALKVLPGDVAGDPDRRRRFLDEARAAGGLSHPNILAVYDVSLDDGGSYIVTELVDGRQLREEIDRGAVATRRLLELAAQLAAGLGAAHAAGIAHRDLKPENVIVTRDGRAKILDFGLAKTFALAPAASLAPTQATLTLPGTVVGTPNYMSPEQARGVEVDYRSDQFSLGVVLYEMATGTHPFRRETTVQTMSAILVDEAPPIATLNPRIPAAVRWVIERCLAKEPGDRYASTDDLTRDLQTLLRRLSELSSTTTPAIGAASRRPVRALVIAAAIVAALLLGLALRGAPEPAPVMTYKPLVTEMRFQGAPAWSPDGSTIAFVSSANDVLQVYTKSIDSPFAQRVTDSRFDCSDPFWSPDGTRLFYHSLAQDAEGLWSISAAGGPPEAVVLNAVGATITPDGRTFAFFREEDEGDSQASASGTGLSLGIWTASADGSGERKYTGAPFDTSAFVAGTMRFSPDGTRLLAWVWGWVGDDQTTPISEFWVIPWPVGQPYKVLPDLSRAAPAAASFDWMPDSRRIIVSLWDGSNNGMHLWMADIDAQTSVQITSTTRSENRPDVSPSGRTIAFADEEIDFDILEIPLDGGSPRPLLATARNELDPTFASDGSRYAYVSDKDGELRIWLRSRDGQFEQPLVSRAQFPGDSTITLGAPAISPHGDRIAYQRYAEKSGYQIWISSVTGGGQPVQLVSSSLYQDAPTWSPDGTEIAFVGRIKGSPSALMRARIGGAGGPTVILHAVPLLTSRPAWSPDGRWIACQTSEGLVIVRPDGTGQRTVSEEGWIAFTWESGSRRIVGLREAERPRHFALVSLDIDTGAERVINPDLGVIPAASQPIRGMAVLDRGVLVTSIASARSEIALGEGFAAPSQRWWVRFLPGR
jgi:serine/threonine protein kinase